MIMVKGSDACHTYTAYGVEFVEELRALVGFGALPWGLGTGLLG